MSWVALVLVLVGFVLGCAYDPMPAPRPRTWRSSGWVPVAGSVSVLAAVVLLGAAGNYS